MGTYYYTSNFDPKNLDNSYTYPNTWFCFGQLHAYYQKGDNLYVGLSVPKDTAEKFAEDFNSVFDNIKMRIVYTANYMYIRRKNAYDHYAHESKIEEIKKKDLGLSVGEPKGFSVFTLDFNGHSDIVKLCFYTIIGELLRCTSKDYSFTVTLNKDSNYFIDTFNQCACPEKLRGNNTHGSNPFFNTPIDLETFKIFDDVERINEILNVDKTYYGLGDEKYWVRSRYQLSFSNLQAPTVTARILMKYKNGEPEVNNTTTDYPKYFMNRPVIRYRNSRGQFCRRNEAVNVPANN